MLPPFIVKRRPTPHAVDVDLARPELPYFAEYASFCWGPIRYGTQGDCQRPTDRRWTWLELESAASHDRILVFRPDDAAPRAGFPHRVRVEATSAKLVWLAVYLTMRRTPSVVQLRRRGHLVGFAGVAEQYLQDEDVDSAWERTLGLRGMFESEALRAYDGLEWWEGWKGDGNGGALRALLVALAGNDRTALPRLFEALDGGVADEHRAGYFRALEALTGQTFATDRAWVDWWRRRQGTGH